MCWSDQSVPFCKHMWHVIIDIFPFQAQILHHKATSCLLFPITLFWRVFKNSRASVYSLKRSRSSDIVQSTSDGLWPYIAHHISAVVSHPCFSQFRFHYCRALWGWRKSDRRVTSLLKRRGRHNDFQKPRERETDKRKKERNTQITNTTTSNAALLGKCTWQKQRISVSERASLFPSFILSLCY